MKRMILTLFLLALLLTALPAGNAHANRYDRIIGTGDVVEDDITVFDDDLLIEEGAIVNGAITVFDGHVDVDGTVNGDLTVFEGDVAVRGIVTGDLVVFGGNLRLTDAAQITGSCFSLGGEIDDESSAASCAAYGSRFLEDMPLPPLRPQRSDFLNVEAPRRAATPAARFFVGLSETVGRSLLLGILALVVGAVFPRHLGRVSQTVGQKPAASGVVGFLTAIAAPSLLILLLVVLFFTCVGILLYPAVFLLGLVPLVALLLGWIAVGERFGNLLVGRLHMTARSQAVTAALGTAGLTFILGLLSILPPFNLGGGFGAALIGLVLASVGLGAAVLTKLGTRTYPLLNVKTGKIEGVLETMPEEDTF